MRTLVVGAGAVGGYFGGRLLEAGRHVTFLVRPGRASQLARTGLRIRSRFGNVDLPKPPVLLAGEPHQGFDLVLLSCKAYDLEGAIESIAPFVGPDTAVLPLLNGMRHLDVLDERLGREHILGGRCVIAATLNAEGEVVHLNDSHGIAFGERDGSDSERVRAIAALMQGAGFESQASGNILLDMWEKWVFLASLAGSTCLMRASIGEICEAPGGVDFIVALLDECRSIAAAAGYVVREESWQRTAGMLTAKGSTLTASMLRDIERNAPIEAGHIIGDLLRRAQGQVQRLSIAYTHLKAYELRRKNN
jgi:2-dehydropantoate 2-reductase